MVFTSFSFRASMMRWNPSVSSCSPPAAVAPTPCPVADIPLPPQCCFGRAPVARPSIEFDEALHVVAQTQRVLTDEPLGSFGVARLERRYDLLVIHDRSLRPVLLENGALPDGAYMEEQVVGDLHDQGALAEADDGLVELDIGFRVFAHVTGDLVLGELVDQGV